jgi:SSS family solute:Na+ symporter
MIPAAASSTGSTGWTSMPILGSPFWWTLVSTLILGVGIGVLSQPQLVVRFMTVKSNKELNRAVLIGGVFIAMMTGTAFIVGALSNVYFMQHSGQIAIQATGGNADTIIPLFIATAMPVWFAYLFMITLLSAAMSTLSAQFHVQGTALGRDIYETLANKTGGSSIMVARAGILIAVLIAVILGFILPANIIAEGTAMWFSLTAVAFLAMYVCALFWKRTTRQGAIAGLVIGTVYTVFSFLFINQKAAAALGISQALTGKVVLITTMPWPVVDPIVIGVPLVFIITIVVSLLTKPPSDEHLDKCFKDVG